MFSTSQYVRQKAAKWRTIKHMCTRNSCAQHNLTIFETLNVMKVFPYKYVNRS